MTLDEAIRRTGNGDIDFDYDEMTDISCWLQELKDILESNEDDLK